MTDCVDIAVIGGGPAGYKAAQHAAENGFNTVLFESDNLGGTCLNAGCIPTKAWLHEAELFSQPQVSQEYWTDMTGRTQRILNRSRRAIEGQVNKSGVTIIKEPVQNLSKDKLITASNNKYCFKKCILATGTIPAIPKPLMSIQSHPKVLTNSTIFSLSDVPESLLIIGGGVIGIEFAFIFASFGIPVHVVELQSDILLNMDTDLRKEAMKLLKRKKVKLHTSIHIDDIGPDLRTTLSNGTIISPSHILMATGRRPVWPTTDLSFDLTSLGYLKTNRMYQTNQKNIYAIGDVNGQSLYAHSAEFQAVQLIHSLTTDTSPVHASVPQVIYLSPALSSIGYDSTSSVIPDVSTYRVPLGAAGKAQARNTTDGWIKIHLKDNRLIGCQIVAPDSDDLLAFCALAIDRKIPADELLQIIYPHPSNCEILKEALTEALRS